MTPPVDMGEVDGVVIQTDSGVPVAVGQDLEGKVFVSQAGDKNFGLMLQALGYREDEVPEVVPASGG